MKKIIIGTLKISISIILLLVLSVVLFVNLAPTFGSNPSAESLQRIKTSKNFDGEKFFNLVATQVDTRDPKSGRSIWETLGLLFSPPKGKNPVGPLPTIKFKEADLIDNSFVWLGHSTILMKTDQVIILTDPVFNQASPIPGTITAFDMEQPVLLDDLPEKIDVVLISHDHYDHLDYQAIRDLTERVDYFFVPLGIQAHLMKWGVPKAKIKERDWYGAIDYKNISFTATPARHFSGRGLTNRFSTLWCSWVVRSKDLNVFFNGDSGYFEEFKKIGQQYGPFDIAFMENGAYDQEWSEIHMLPEESVQANIDLRSKVMFPIHWGKFDLANHPWDEPIIRADQETTKQNVKIATPLIGEVFTLEQVPHERWWELVGKRSGMNEQAK